MEDTPGSYLGFFTGGVPAGAILSMALDELKGIVLTHEESHSHTLYEISFVGAVSYFEAFCKDNYASIINIYPNIIRKLKEEIINTDINARKIIDFSDNILDKIGFLICENLDFGTSKTTNSKYYALLGITPFSKNNSARFDEILRDRNLIVHHGGIYTLKYLRQADPELIDITNHAFLYSKVVERTDVIELIKFLSSMAQEMLCACQAALRNKISEDGAYLDPVRARALNNIAWWNFGEDAD